MKKRLIIIVLLVTVHAAHTMKRSGSPAQRHLLFGEYARQSPSPTRMREVSQSDDQRRRELDQLKAQQKADEEEEWRENMRRSAERKEDREEHRRRTLEWLQQQFEEE